MDFSALAATLKAVRNVSNYALYILKSNGTVSLPAGLSGMSYVDAAHLLATAGDTAALRAVGLWAMARCLDETKDERTVYEGKTLGAQELCLEALRCDGRCSEAFCLLGYLVGMSESSTLTLPDGRALNALQFHVEALRCDPTNAIAYYNIGSSLGPRETVVLHDGRVLNEPQLYIEALRWDVTISHAYYNLGVSLIGDETIVLHDGRALNKSQSYVEALRYNDTHTNAYTNLGIGMSAGEVIVLHDGRTLNQHQLFLEALCREPSPEMRSRLLRATSPAQAWSRHSHSLVFGTMPVNVLFATLWLGLQRLETDGVLPPAHHSMLEDMLEGWTWGDAQRC